MTSLSGSSDSRNSSCAMTTFATSSSIARAEEHDAVLEQAREQVPAALAPVGLLDDRGHQRRRDISVISRHRVSGVGQPRHQRRAREPPVLAQLAARQLAGLGQLDHDRLLDLEELARLARRSSPPAGRRPGTSTSPASAPARRGRASPCASTASPARSARGGCRGRRTSRPGSATRSFLRIPSASAARSSLSTAVAGRRTNSALSGGGFLLGISERYLEISWRQPAPQRLLLTRVSIRAPRSSASTRVRFLRAYLPLRYQTQARAAKRAADATLDRDARSAPRAKRCCRRCERGRR